MPRGIYKRTEEIKKAIGLSKTGNKNPNWLGESVGKIGLHARIKRNNIIPKFCQGCGKNKKLDLANKSGNYKTDMSDWLWLCRKCHMKYDGTDILLGNKLKEQTRRDFENLY